MKLIFEFDENILLKLVVYLAIAWAGIISLSFAFGLIARAVLLL